MLTPVNKNTVKAIIRKSGKWAGYIAPNNVNSFHIRGGWHIGMQVEFTDLDEMEKTCQNFAWYNCNSELGQRIRFWQEK